MTTLAICVLVAGVGFLLGWIRGFFSAIRYIRALDVDDSDDFVLGQRESAPYQ